MPVMAKTSSDEVAPRSSLPGRPYTSSVKSVRMARSTAERVQGGERHDCADGFGHVAAPHADALGDALASRGKQGHDLLEPGARGGDETEAPH